MLDIADDDDPTTPKGLFRVPGTHTLCVAHPISQIKNSITKHPPPPYKISTEKFRPFYFQTPPVTFQNRIPPPPYIFVLQSAYLPLTRCI
jgi:hypothetical protein